MGKNNKKAQLRASDVERGLKALGFKARPQKATSHVQWVKDTPSGRLKVTLDAAKQPFSEILAKSMARQAGVTLDQFYEVCSKGGAKAAKRGFLDWLTS